MIKKLFLCAALVGAVGLTSCVDNVEPLGTTEIRNAKAEQLKALAEADKIQAEAAILSANAQQKITEASIVAQQANNEWLKAQAAHKNAEAAYWQAVADGINAQTEADKAEAAVWIERRKIDLEEKKVQLEKDKLDLQAAQEELKAIIASYESEIERYKKETWKANNNLKALIEGVKGKEYKILSDLVANYISACDHLNRVQDLLNDQKTTLAKYEAGLSNDYETLYKQIKGLQANNYSLSNQIAEDQAKLAVYLNPDAADAIEKLGQLQEETPALEAALTKASQANTEAQIAAANAEVAFNNSDYTIAIDNLKNTTPLGFSIEKVYTSYAPAEAKGNWCAVYTTTTAGNVTVTNYLPLFTDGSEKLVTNQVKYTTSQIVMDNTVLDDDGNIDWDKSTWHFEPETKTVNANYMSLVEPYYAPFDANGKKFEDLLDAKVADLTKTKQDCDKAYDKYTKLQAPLLEAEKNYEAAKNANTNLPTNDPNATALSNAQKNAGKKLLEAINNVRVEQGLDKVTIDFESDTYYVQLDDKSLYYTPAQNYIDSEVKYATKEKNNADNAFADAEKVLPEVKANLKTISTGYADFSKLVANVNSTRKTRSEASVENRICQGKVDVNKALIHAYNSVITGQNNGVTVDDYKKEIARLEKAIKNNQKKIEDNNKKIAELQADLDNPELSLDMQKVVADLKAEIEKLEAEVATVQAQVEVAKAALDAALKAETPAEK